MTNPFSGTAAAPVQYLYGADAAGSYVAQVKLTSTGGANEWVKTYTDMAGRAYETVLAPARAPLPPYPTTTSRTSLPSRSTRTPS